MIFGAFDREKLIGSIGLFRIERAKRRHKASIWGMYVSETHRGKGVGRMLLDEAIRAARAMPDVRLVGLSVITVNQAARQLYLNAGFRPYGLEPRSLKVGDRYYDEEHMILEL